MTILSDRDITPAERAAIADEPRCGVWVEEHEVFSKVEVDPLSRRTGMPVEIKSTIETRGDGRMLTQHEADRLIVTELHRRPEGYDDQAELVRAVGFPLVVMLGSSTQPGYEQAFTQRGEDPGGRSP